MAKNFPLSTSYRFLLLVTMTLLLLVVGIFSYFFERQLGKTVFIEQQQALKQEGKQASTFVQQHFLLIKDDLSTLHSVVADTELTQFLLPIETLKGNRKFKQWKTQLEQLFVAFMAPRTEYVQIRVISAVDGMELLRVENGATEPVIADIENLQNKQDSDYFIRTNLLENGQWYMSGVSLNREKGEIQVPFRPIIKISKPLFGERGKRFGFVIIDVNAQILLDKLQHIIAPNMQFMITDQDSHFVYHQEPDYQYSADLSPEKTWSSRYTEQSISDLELLKVSDQLNPANVFYTYRQALLPFASNLSQSLQLHLMLDEKFISEVVNKRRAYVYGFVAMMLISALLVFALLYSVSLKMAKLAQLNGHSSAILEATDEAVITIDSQVKVLTLNNAAEKLFSISKDYATGKSLNGLGIFFDVDIGRQIAELDSGARIIKKAIRYAFQGDRVVDLNLTFLPLRGPQNQLLACAIIIDDVTLEKQTQYKTQKTLQRLEEQIKQRTADLQQASQNKSDFISLYSQQMQLGLNDMHNQLRLVNEQPLTKAQQEYIKCLTHSTECLHRIIEDALDLSRIEAGKLDLLIEPFNPLHLVENLTQRFAPEAQNKGLEFILDVSKLTANSISTDARRLTQILSNLISNAIKYTHKGYISIFVQDSVDPHGDLQMRFSVQDSGDGIDEQEQDTIFMPFAQVSRNTSQHEGTGLGLAIAQNLASLLGGQLGYESKPELGSRFFIDITFHSGRFNVVKAESRLRNELFVVDTINPVLEATLSSLVSAFDGELRPYSWLDNVPVEELQGMKITMLIDNASEHLAEAMSRCEHLQGAGVGFQFVILRTAQEKQRTQVKCPYITLTKPVLRSEFLSVFADKRVATVEQTNKHDQRKPNSSLTDD